VGPKKGRAPDGVEGPQVSRAFFFLSPRSGGERRSCACRLYVSYSINTVAARTTRIAPANLIVMATLSRPTLPALFKDTGISCVVSIAVAVYALCTVRGERRRRPLHMCSLTFEKMTAILSGQSPGRPTARFLRAAGMTGRSSCGTQNRASA
jgi:hypothetical protein